MALHLTGARQVSTEEKDAALSLMKLGFNKIGDIPVESEPTYFHVIGQPGTGKNDTLIRWAVDDIYAGKGLAFLDLSGMRKN